MGFHQSGAEGQNPLPRPSGHAAFHEENGPRAGAPLLRGKAERVGAVQPGEENTPGRPYSSLPVPEGGLQESWRGTFYKDILR